ncbi:MAG: hypothetical protein CM15mV42_1590 [uncultured marine virus]|nr:MAG: hypothetical protein CM15mV42_1590 [uncultured marine virus]
MLITQDATTFQRIKETLSLNTKYPGQRPITATILSGYKRAFVLPRCPVSLDRVKAACKEHGISITNDYEKADFVITHENIYEKFDNGEKIKTMTLMYRLWNYEAYDNGWSIVNNHDKPVIYDQKWLDAGYNTYSLSNPVSLYDEWGIPGLAMNLAYLIDTNQMDVMKVEDVLGASSNVTDLTLDLVKELSSWLDSYDDDNIAIAGKILPTIDYTKKKHLVWELAQNLYHKTHKFTRDKDVNYWMDMSRIDDYYHMTAQDMILFLENGRAK